MTDEVERVVLAEIAAGQQSVDPSDPCYPQALMVLAAEAHLLAAQQTKTEAVNALNECLAGN